MLGVVDASRMGTGLTNDIGFEIFGEQGAIRFSGLDPAWLEVYDVRDADKPTGGMRGFRKVETVQRYAGQKAPDWSMAPDFVRTHAECQYQFLKAVAEDRPTQPTLADGLHIQAVMAAAERSSQMGRWVEVSEVLRDRLEVRQVQRAYGSGVERKAAARTHFLAEVKCTAALPASSAPIRVDRG